MADEISCLLRAGEPKLVLSQRLYWRVPIELALPDRGVVGVAGTLDVDLETGQILATPDAIAEISAMPSDLLPDVPPLAVPYQVQAGPSELTTCAPL